MRGIAAKHLFNTNALMGARNNDTLSFAEMNPLKSGQSSYTTTCLNISEQSMALSQVLMKAFQVPADEITCNALISTYGNSVLWQRSIQVLAKMGARRLEPETLANLSVQR